MSVLPPFQTLLEEHGPAVFRFLSASVARDEAEDCFQETFLAALRAYPRLRSQQNLRAWVFRIAERKAIDAHRARRRRPQPQERLPDAGREDRPATDPAMWSGVRSLPAKQRASVILRYVADLSYADIGAATGSSEEAARQNARAGLAKLREWLT